MMLKKFFADWQKKRKEQQKIDYLIDERRRKLLDNLRERVAIQEKATAAIQAGDLELAKKLKTEYEKLPCMICGRTGNG